MAQVTLILHEDVQGLGAAGEVVKVKPGYARNFLVPHGKATVASEARLKELEHHRRHIEEKLAKELKDLRASQRKLEALQLEVAARVGEEGKLFGSVTLAQVAELLAEKGFEIDRRKIALADSIKEAGEHEIQIRLHREVVATVKLKVTAEE
jgi:large subunit ribosomal protein L9